MNPVSILGATGHVGGRYCALYPHETVAEPRECRSPTQTDTLSFVSTVSNYAPLRGELKEDIYTNLCHPMEVLPNVRGTFTQISTWFCVANSGTSSAHPAREDDCCDPNGFYGITAAAREKLIRSYAQTYTKPYRILRLCNVLGVDPRASKQKNALIHLLAKVKRGEDVEVYTGDQYRNHMHVDDVCRAIHLCLECDETLNSITHIGAPRSERTIDLIEHARAITGSKSRITLVAPPRFHQIVQVPDFHMATDKLRGLGFVPDMDAYQAVERVVAAL
jgi:nucleoside-diphosphate-sugar epimerase